MSDDYIREYSEEELDELLASWRARAQGGERYAMMFAPFPLPIVKLRPTEALETLVATTTEDVDHEIGITIAKHPGNDLQHVHFFVEVDYRNPLATVRMLFNAKEQRPLLDVVRATKMLGYHVGDGKLDPNKVIAMMFPTELFDLIYE